MALLSMTILTANVTAGVFFDYIDVGLIAVIILGIICDIVFLLYRAKKKKREAIRLALARSVKNPIVSPDRRRLWELEGTFNPGAVLDDEGRVHLFYRAVGGDGLSRVGHASSRDGIHFDERSPYPVFQPPAGFGLPDAAKVRGPAAYDPTYYTSGGGWGGAEDPRAVRLDGRIYLTYVAFEGWENMKMAVTSIGAEDMKWRRWNWRRPSRISRGRSKNWVLFPEKIGGKFAILHGLLDKALIEYADNLDYVPDIKSLPNRDCMPGYRVSNRHGYWDEWTRGAGTPPLRTDRGWLLFYNVVDPRDPGKYKVGAMLLDLTDPSRITHRSPSPVLAPEASYENDGKPGIVYASGSVIKDGTVFLYYGAGDRHVGVATVPLDKLLDWLTASGEV